MNINTKSIKPWHIAILLVNSVLGGATYYLPGLLAKYVGHDSWLFLLFVTVIPIFYAYLIISFFGNSEKGFIQILDNIFGKVIARILGIAFVIVITIICATTLRTMSDVINTVMLPYTPVTITTAVIMLCAIYIISKGFPTILRTNITLAVVFGCLFILYFFTLSNGSIKNIMPIGDFGARDFGNATISSMRLFIGAEMLFIFYPLLQSKKGIKRATTIGYIIASLMYSFILLVCTFVFSEYALADIRFGSLMVLKNSSAMIIERMDTFSIIFFNLLTIKPLINYGFVAYQTGIQMFNKLGKHQNLVLLVWAIVIIIMSMQLQVITELQTWRNYIVLALPLFTVVLPIISIIKNKLEARACAS